ncbi:MAG: TadE/TadG family type IV pilus assembly protein [Planctomycetota bacterium]
MIVSRSHRGLGGRQSCRRRDAGLAPLEFVLWLPVLLFTMALMVNYGTMAAWRLRGEAAAHDAGWRTRWPRNGGGEPDPAASIAVVTRTENVRQMPQLAMLDMPALQLPVARGPLPNGFVVNDSLDPSKGAVAGNASVRRDYPLLSKAGSFNSGPIDDPLLHNAWTNGEMGISNWYRRSKVLYQLPQTDPALPQAFQAAVMDAVSIPHLASLSVMDQDADWLEYRGWAPNYYPRIRHRCTLDRDEMRKREVERLVDVWQPNQGVWRLGSISRLPSTMTNSFLGMFRSTLSQFQAELNSVPPPPPDRVAYLQMHIPILEAKISQLEQFQARIPDFEDPLKNRPAPMP